MFGAVCAVRAKREPIDIVTVEEALRAAGELEIVGGLEGITAYLDRHVIGESVEHHAGIVAGYARRRSVMLAARSAVELGYDDELGPDEYASRAESMVLGASSVMASAKSMGAREACVEAYKRIVSRSKVEGGITGVRTGYVDIDKRFLGMQPAEVIILAARPSMGKTALAMNIVERVCAAGVPSLVFSLEMDSGQLTERLASGLANLDSRKLRTGRLIGDDWKDLQNAFEKIARWPMEIVDTTAPTIDEIRGKARRWRSDRSRFTNHEHGLIVVDYLQLARGATKGRSREQEVSEVSAGLKAMAKELRCPVLALAQLNRGVEGREGHRPNLSDLRESGAIEQDADVIAFLHRPERYAKEGDDLRAMAGRAELIVAKHRSGEPGTVALTFRKEFVRFEDAEQ